MSKKIKELSTAQWRVEFTDKAERSWVYLGVPESMQISGDVAWGEHAQIIDGQKIRYSDFTLDEFTAGFRSAVDERHKFLTAQARSGRNLIPSWPLADIVQSLKFCVKKFESKNLRLESDGKTPEERKAKETFENEFAGEPLQVADRHIEDWIATLDGGIFTTGLCVIFRDKPHIPKAMVKYCLDRGVDVKQICLNTYRAKARKKYGVNLNSNSFFKIEEECMAAHLKQRNRPDTFSLSAVDTYTETIIRQYYKLSKKQ